MTAPLSLYRALDSAASNESYTWIKDRAYRGGLRPIIFVTGIQSDDRAFLTSAASGSGITRPIASVGEPMLSAQFGGKTYPSPTCIDRIGKAWAKVKGDLPTKTDKFIGIGTSKGYAALDRYARENPTHLAALVGIVPGVNLITVHDENRGGLASDIEAGFGGFAGWEAEKAAADCITNQAAHAALNLPTLLFYGSADTIITPAEQVAYAAAADCEAVQVTGDHNTAALSIDPNDVLDFLEPFA